MTLTQRFSGAGQWEKKNAQRPLTIAFYLQNPTYCIPTPPTLDDGHYAPYGDHELKTDEVFTKEQLENRLEAGNLHEEDRAMMQAALDACPG